MIFVFYLLFTNIACQAQVELNYNWFYGKQIINLTQGNFTTLDGDTIVIDQLKCYISKIECLDHEKVVYSEKNSFHLLDAAANDGMKIFLPFNGRFNSLRFVLGIDSLTNVSGAMTGDLDPSLNMYWTWQSGYINCKIEGRKGPDKKNFQFHLGGYAYPFKNCQTVNLNVQNNQKIVVAIQMDQWFKTNDFTKNNHIMSPSAKAVEMSSQLKNCFIIANP